MQIAIVLGHNERAQGAVRVTDGVSEYIWNGRLAEAIAELNPEQVRVFRREWNPAGYRAEIGEVYARVDEWGADVAAELHFNAASGAATGTETWYVSTAGKALAQTVNDAMVSALKLSNRGIKKAEKGARGYESMITGRCPAVLIESYFGSSWSDCEIADARFHDLAKGLFWALGGSLAAPVPTPVPMTLEQRVARLEALAGLRTDA